MSKKDEAKIIMEKRVITDNNGFIKEEVRFLPVADYEPNDGWRTTRIIASNIIDGIKNEM